MTPPSREPHPDSRPNPRPEVVAGAATGASAGAGAPGDERRPWRRRHLLDVASLSREEIEFLFETARSFREVSTRSVKKVPALRGRVVVNLFYEPSTRTRISFTLAAQRLSADVVDFNGETSSVKKGETLLDTARNIIAMGVDTVVLRHPAPGAPQFLSERVQACVINAGDGAHAHPTQGLLDLFTVIDKLGSVENKRIAIVGDIRHSRVARSDMWAFLRFGAKVVLVGPPTLVPSSLRDIGVDVSYSLDEVLPEVDVLCLLRIQSERQEQGLFPSLEEYSRLFGLNSERMRRARPDVLVLHPGPINRGIEITPEVADGPRSAILEQVTNGLAVRMAALYLTAGGDA
ncbi:MAG: aspartate carbamoyltransferase catalytic subunit [Planctomycetes bacterium]|nr:aspartate carbamoyltransferase catalytic subunit [Planctomycetota bacterium]